jgi:hypothetical protein
MKDNLTILTTTHFKASAHILERGYPANHDRKNTSTELIEYMILNLYKKLNSNEIIHYISLDHDPKNEGSCEYLENLKLLSKKHPNIRLIITIKGIRESILNLINSVETKYFLWFEHDWEFNSNISLVSLLNLMDKYNNINYIRFNKRSNIISGVDSMLKQYNYKLNNETYNLCATNGWSNNPYLGRKDNWDNFWLKILNNSKRKYVTIELELQNEYRKDINELGFDKAIEKWGVYLYGNINNKKTVNHLNGRNK